MHVAEAFLCSDIGSINRDKFETPGDARGIFRLLSHIRVSAARLKARTTLFGDLGVDGDDGDELMVAFMKRFGVDMTIYRGDRHFGPKGFAPMDSVLLARVGVASAHRERKYARESRTTMPAYDSGFD